MNLCLYAGDHAWLLVPDDMSATQAAVGRHGPLEPMFELDQGSLEADELAKVMAWIDVERYAEISEETAKRLIEER